MRPYFINAYVRCTVSNIYIYFLNNNMLSYILYKKWKVHHFFILYYDICLI